MENENENTPDESTFDAEAFFGVNEDETESENATPDESPIDNQDDDQDDDEFSFESFESKSDPVEMLKSKLDDESKLVLDELVAGFGNEREGFSKLHEQVKAVRDIAGVQSLNEVIEHYNTLTPMLETFGALSEDNESTRDEAIQAFFQIVSNQTGLDADEILDVVSGVASPKVKPSQNIGKEQALKVLGLSAEEVSEYQLWKGGREYAAKNAKAFDAASTKFGFNIDPSKVFAIKQANPGISDEAALLQAHPKEYKAYLATKGSKKAGLANKSDVPQMSPEGATAPRKKTTSEMSGDELLTTIKSFF